MNARAGFIQIFESCRYFPIVLHSRKPTCPLHRQDLSEHPCKSCHRQSVHSTDACTSWPSSKASFLDNLDHSNRRDDLYNEARDDGQDVNRVASSSFSSRRRPVGRRPVGRLAIGRVKSTLHTWTFISSTWTCMTSTWPTTRHCPIHPNIPLHCHQTCRNDLRIGQKSRVGRES